MHINATIILETERYQKNKNSTEKDFFKLLPIAVSTDRHVVQMFCFINLGNHNYCYKKEE